jgi:hypothetical protein
MKPFIDLHAGVSVLVKRASAHSVPIYRNAVTFSSLPRGNAAFDSIKQTPIGFAWR